MSRTDILLYIYMYIHKYTYTVYLHLDLFVLFLGFFDWNSGRDGFGLRIMMM